MQQIIRGIQKEPFVLTIYGAPGVGKSSLASGSPIPLFIGPEKNNNLNTLKLPPNKTHDELLQSITDIGNGCYKNEGIKTLVLDTIDVHEKVIQADILKQNPGKNMETAFGGYGKAYKEMYKRLTQLKDCLDVTRKKQNLNIIILGHCFNEKVTDYMVQLEYDQFTLPLHKGKRFDCNAIFFDWSDAVLFMNYKNYKDDNNKYASGMGIRTLYTECRPSQYAKNRFKMPYEIEIDNNESNYGFDKITYFMNNYYECEELLTELRQSIQKVPVQNQEQFINDVKTNMSNPEILKKIKASIS